MEPEDRPSASLFPVCSHIAPRRSIWALRSRISRRALTPAKRPHATDPATIGKRKPPVNPAATVDPAIIPTHARVPRAVSTAAVLG